MEKLNSNHIILVVLTIVVSFTLTKMIRVFMTRASEKYLHKRIIIKNFIPIINICVNIAAIFFISFGILKITRDTMLALGLSAGVAIGFAVQDILQNVFGGLIIIFSRPFNIGDKIKVGDWYGEVMDISLLRVKLKTAEEYLVSIPSKTFLQSSTSNSNSGALDCQVVTDIVVTENLSGEFLMQLGKEVAWASAYTWLAKPVSANILDRFDTGVSARLVRIRAHVFDHRYEGRYSSDISLRFKDEVARYLKKL